MRRLRMDAGKTIDALAKESGVSTRTIISIEQGSANPRLSIVEAMAVALGVSVSDLTSIAAEGAA